MSGHRQLINRSIDWIARIGLVATTLAMIAVAVFAWNGGHFLSPVRIVFYGFAPIGVACVTLYAAMSNIVRRWLIIVTATSVGVAFIAAEMVLLTDGQPTPNALEIGANQLSVDFIPQICSGTLPVDGVTTRNSVTLMPLGGIANREILHQGYIISSDRFGFKNPDEIWDLPNVAALVVGDSFTYGSDVHPREGFVELLRERGLSAINLGCGGNGPLAELGAIVEYAPKVKADWIIWVYFEGNDLTKDINRELGSPILVNYLNPDFYQDLASRQDDIDDALMSFVKSQRNAAQRPKHSTASIRWLPIFGLTNLRTRLGLTNGFETDSLASFSVTLQRASSIVSELKAKLLFVYLPSEIRYRTLLGAADSAGFGSAVKNAAKKSGFRVLDIAMVLQKTGIDPSSFYRGHFNRDGYALVAEAIAESIGK